MRRPLGFPVRPRLICQWSELGRKGVWQTTDCPSIFFLEFLMYASNERLLRLWDVIGDKSAGIPAIIPISRTTWYDGIKRGIYPAPIKLSPRVTAWRASDVYALTQK